MAFAGVSWAQQNHQPLESAKKEGQVVWYGTLNGGSIVGWLISTFESKNPFIKVKYLRLGGAGFLERVRTEARAGKFFWDVVTSEYIQFFELSKQIALAKYAAPEVRNYPQVHKDPAPG
jgi:ABC-type glycerol-3-phosphate transport system substrate-binding protein